MVVFTKVPNILLTVPACVKPPVKPIPVGALQVYTVPAGTMPFTPSVGVILNPTPLQVVTVIGLIEALGFKYIVTENTVPVQLPTTGVTKYVAVTIELVVELNVPVILLIPELWVNPPVKPNPVGAFQL